MSKLKTKHNIIKRIISALAVGFINGFFGGGGGLVCVPTLERVYNLNTKNAHATTIAIMLPLSLISSVVYIFNNSININILIAITVGVLIGGVLGAIFLKKLKGSLIRWIFIFILFIAGIRMVILWFIIYC